MTDETKGELVEQESTDVKEGAKFLQGFMVGFQATLDVLRSKCLTDIQSPHARGMVVLVDGVQEYFDACPEFKIAMGELADPVFRKKLANKILRLN